uniref:Pectinesterase inhibitor domain-containing protein n=1 Tax=Fagus sylvatica TaxID=28930 RepID=A0A2N9EMS6_FAGSY
MACTSKILVLLVPMFLSLIAEPHLVNGDAALINTVCSKTTSPNYCHLCFNCVALSPAPSFILKPEPGQLGGQKRFAHSSFTLPSEAVTNALVGWQDGHYIDASNQILVALKLGHDCLDKISSYNPPSFLSDRIYTFMGLCEASYGVLQQLPASSL